MKPTEELMQEHRAIEVMLKVMERIAERLRSGDAVDKRDLERVLEFLQVFVDRCHHGKEEDLLFPALIETGMPEEGGPVAVMLEEHRMGRDHIRRLGEAVAVYGWDRAAGSSRIVESATEYVGLLAEHIYKEDNILYPMADGSLSRDKQEALHEGFERIERETVGEGRHEEFHRLLSALKEGYL